MALPVWLTWEAAKRAGPAIGGALKLAALAGLIWYGIGAFKHWVDAKATEREALTALIEEKVQAKNDVATQQAAAETLRQTIEAQEQALAEARAATEKVNAQFTAYRRGEAARNARFLDGRFKELLQANPTLSEEQINKYQQESNAAYMEVFRDE